MKWKYVYGNILVYIESFFICGFFLPFDSFYCKLLQPQLVVVMVLEVVKIIQYL